MTRSLIHPSLAAIVLLAAACSRPPPAPPAAAAPVPATAPAMAVPPAGSAGPADAPLQLRIVTASGAPFDLAAQRGHWVVLNFWATWCKPCLKEMPALSALAQQRSDLRLLGLAWDEIDAAGFAAFVRDHPVAYPLAQVDTQAPPPGIEAPLALPATWVIDPHGRVVKRVFGEITPEQILAVVDARPGTP